MSVKENAECTPNAGATTGEPPRSKPPHGNAASKADQHRSVVRIAQGGTSPSELRVRFISDTHLDVDDANPRSSSSSTITRSGRSVPSAVP
jgi:hypothetical protein